VTAANTADQVGFHLVFVSVLPLLLCVVKVFADKGYRGLERWLQEITQGQCHLSLVAAAGATSTQQEKRLRGFAIQPKRWIVERSISWLQWSRRLSKDYEQTPTSSQAGIDVSAIRMALRKATK
jgi:transposase